MNQLIFVKCDHPKDVDYTKISDTTTVLLIYLKQKVVWVFTLKDCHKFCSFYDVARFYLPSESYVKPFLLHKNMSVRIKMYLLF